MSTPAPLQAPPTGSSAVHPALRVLVVFGLLYAFLVGVNGLGDGFKALGQGLTNPLFALTDNPFMALVVGILTTTLVQSSSVTTSLVVALTAAPDNPLPIENAVPMIMGANIGTTVTAAIVALAHMGRREEFRRAFEVATCHDFFNLMTVAVLLPLELATGFLRSAAEFMAARLGFVGGVEYDSPIKMAIKAGVQPFKSGIAAITESADIQAGALVVFSCVLIVVALGALVRVMRSVMQTRVESMVTRALGQRIWLAMLLGIIATVMVQSSSITTSLLVPLAGAGLLTLPQAFPITVGANIGTTITALLAAMAVTGANATAGLTIALVHLLFNLSGTFMILPWPPIRRLPLMAAERLAALAVRSRQWAILFVVMVFYGLPALLAAVGYFWGVGMLRELLSIFSSDNPLKAMGDNFAEMLRLSRELTVKAGAMYFEKSTVAEDRTWVYERDIEINKLERLIRKQVIAHLSLKGNAISLPYCLALMSLVKDVERVGDYAKNLSEVVDFSPGPLPDDECAAELREIRNGVEHIFAATAHVVDASDDARAMELIHEGRDIARRADALVATIARGGYDASTATALVLGTRYFKRIGAHMLNVLSSVVMPLHKLDYYDETHLAPDEQD